jgi:hypothetical protein
MHAKVTSCRDSTPAIAGVTLKKVADVRFVFSDDLPTAGFLLNQTTLSARLRHLSGVMITLWGRE